MTEYLSRFAEVFVRYIHVAYCSHCLCTLCLTTAVCRWHSVVHCSVPKR